MKGLMGIKIGMTQVEDGKGDVVAVTVIEAGPCVVVQKKTSETDGYDAVQLGFVECKEKRYSKAVNGLIDVHSTVLSFSLVYTI